MNIPQISLETANRFYSWGWKASLLGAGITLFGVGFLMWGTRRRDRDFETRVAATSERAAKLELEAASATLALERLRQQVGPRNMSQDQLLRLIDALKRIAPNVPEIQIERLGDAEAAAYADMFILAINTAGIRLHVAEIGMRAPPAYGMQIFDTPDGIIDGAFRAAGIRLNTTNRTAPGTVPRIVINLKRPQ